MSTRDGPYDEPPAKRQKLQTDIQRSPDFWFKRGDFVLVASHKMAYRLHADVLARQSAVFNDMLNLDGIPRPTLEDTMDGCPIVHITDSPEDFDTFLSFVYDGFKRQRLHAKEPRWTTVRVMMLLGDKYDVPELREEGLSRLRAWYAEDIDEWDARDEAFFAHETDHLSVASITHTLGEPTLHAAVLYYCATLSPALLMAGDPATGYPPLCAADHIRMRTFTGSVPQAWKSFEYDADVMSDSVGGQCGRCAPCRASHIRSSFDDIIRKKIDSCSSKFLDYAVWVAVGTSYSNVCDDCWSYYEEYLRALRQRCRSKLPEYFGYVQPFVKPVL